MPNIHCLNSTVDSMILALCRTEAQTAKGDSDANKRANCRQQLKRKNSGSSTSIIFPKQISSACLESEEYYLLNHTVRHKAVEEEKNWWKTETKVKIISIPFFIMAHKLRNESMCRTE